MRFGVNHKTDTQCHVTPFYFYGNIRQRIKERRILQNYFKWNVFNALWLYNVYLDSL